MDTDLLLYTIALGFGLATRFAVANRTHRGKDILLVVHLAVCCLGFVYDCPLFVFEYLFFTFGFMSKGTANTLPSRN